MELVRPIRIKLGDLLLQEGLIQKQQLEEALMVQKRQSVYKPLGEVCIELGFIARITLRDILAKHQKQILLGDLLVNMGIITEDQLEEALFLQRHTNKKLGEMLIEKGFMTPSALAEALSVQLGVPKITPHVQLADSALLNGVNTAFLEKIKAVPICYDKDRDLITVLMDDPLDSDAVAVLEKMFKKKVEPAVSTTGSVESLLREMVSKEVRMNAVKSAAAQRTGSAKGFAPQGADPEKNFAAQKRDEENFSVTMGSEKRRTDGELVIIDNRLPDSVSQDDNMAILNFIVSGAVQKGASDIHIEPFEKKVRIRYRLDGLLRHETDLPKAVGVGLATRIKAVSGLDIADKRRHQDGRIEARVKDKEVDLRVSTYATIWGENIVIRLLSRQSSLVDLNRIGFSPFNLSRYQRLIKYPSGVILATGPTGSGKTTTLYASLMQLNDMDRKIITVEDPVEYTIEGVVQGKLDPKLGLTYGDFIKSMMRQDPDVIMIGEIREAASASAAIQAALTGHKVFSTFHTDDSTGALLRLMDMGIETFFIASTVTAIVAQRLIRGLCPSCKVPARPSPSVLKVFESIKGGGIEQLNFHQPQPQGCPECNFTGYKGRTGLQEMLEIDDNVRDAIFARKNAGQIRNAARMTGQFISMSEDGFYKAAKGLTTLEEVLRVAYMNKSDALVPYETEKLMKLCDAPEDADHLVVALAAAAHE